MSNIESLDRLREFVEEDAVLVSMIESVEHEIAERLIEPCDADGVPIKPGDLLDFHGFKVNCAAVSQERVYYWDKRHGFWTWENADECCHVKPRTIEDVLREFAEEVYASHADFISIDGENAYLLAAINETADEIREVLGVEE